MGGGWWWLVVGLVASVFGVGDVAVVMVMMELVMFGVDLGLGAVIFSFLSWSFAEGICF